MEADCHKLDLELAEHTRGRQGWVPQVLSSDPRADETGGGEGESCAVCRHIGWSTHRESSPIICLSAYFHGGKSFVQCHTERALIKIKALTTLLSRLSNLLFHHSSASATPGSSSPCLPKRSCAFPRAAGRCGALMYNYTDIIMCVRYMCNAKFTHTCNVCHHRKRRLLRRERSVVRALILMRARSVWHWTKLLPP